MIRRRVRNVAHPPQPVDLTGGRVLAPGESTTTPLDAHARDLLAAGLLVLAPRRPRRPRG